MYISLENYLITGFEVIWDYKFFVFFMHISNDFCLFIFKNELLPLCLSLHFRLNVN